MPESTDDGAARPAASRPRRWLRRMLMLLIALVVLGGSVTGAGVAWLLRSFDEAARPGATPVVVEVPAGASFRTIAADLEARGLIRDARLFLLLGRIEEAGTGLRAGRYELSAASSPRELLRQLTRGEVMQVRVTLPEGYTRYEVADTLAASGLVSRDRFLSITADHDFIASLGIDAPDLEGYLFPDTYRFANGLEAATIARTMVQRFHEVFDAEVRPHLESRGLTRHEAVTLASIVEKESGQDQEKPVVAGVFANRMAKGMRLESDPTVIYGLLPDFDGNITRKHLRTPTPYNTYVIRGLPPGPIANPGRVALAAVAEPADVPYLFFVSKGDGTHTFSTTYAEHKEKVTEYQIRRRRRR